MHLDAFAAANISSSLSHVHIYEDYLISDQFTNRMFYELCANWFYDPVVSICFDLNSFVDFRGMRS